MSHGTDATVECPHCGRAFDPSVSGGWCTDTECGASDVAGRASRRRLVTDGGTTEDARTGDGATEDAPERGDEEQPDVAEVWPDDEASDGEVEADGSDTGDDETDPRADDGDEGTVACPACETTIAVADNFCRACGADVSGIDDSDAGQRVGDLLAAETEEAVYDALGLPWIPPELREDRGEIDAAREGTLPNLLVEGDLRGDLHVHTDWSDGGHSLREMVDAAAEFGHDYVCITDHAEGPGVFGDAGLSDADLREQMDAVDDVRDDVAIEVFHGVEANVDADGDVGAVSDDVLADLDPVVASPHSELGDDGGDRTDRLVAAVEHPHVDVLGHPSGRLLTERPAMAFDAAKLAAAAADAGTALEVNANYHRLDLWGTAVRAAVDAGATIAVDTDAHSPAEYAQRFYGVHTARRGWAEAGDVLNARDADGLRDFLD